MPDAGAAPREPLRDVLEVFVAQHGDAWRVYARGWVAEYVRQRLDGNLEALVSNAPDLTDLHDYMWSLDAPYTTQSSTGGGVAIEARGRSTIMLWEWLDAYLAGSDDSARAVERDAR